MTKRLTGLMLRTLIGLGIFAVLVIAATFALVWLDGRGVVDGDDAVVWLAGAIAVVAMAGAMVISVAWMRAIDEAAREAHKAAWFWGGCGGMALGGVVLIMTSLPQTAEWSFVTFNGRDDPAAYAATGAFAMILLMTAGYTVAWVVWWLQRR